MSEKLYILANSEGVGELLPDLDSMVASLSFYASQDEKHPYSKDCLNVYEITYNPLYLPPIYLGEVRLMFDDNNDVVAFKYLRYWNDDEHVIPEDEQKWIYFKGQYSCRTID